MGGVRSYDERRQEVIDQVRTLWPHMGMLERFRFAQQLKPLFDNDLPTAVRELSAADKASRD